MIKPKAAKRETIHCAYYRWKLYLRNGVYWADGRSNSNDLGRHSLGASTREQALEELKRLDYLMAVKHRLVAEPTPASTTAKLLTIEEGINLYLTHAKRAPAVGGVAKSTAERYETILDHLRQFTMEKGIFTCDQITVEIVEGYAQHRTLQGKKISTIQLEISIILQASNFWVNRKLLSPELRLTYRISRAEETTRYCWRPKEVAAMVRHCRLQSELGWLEKVLIGLSYTGLRISELLQLRWSDIRMDLGRIVLTHERAGTNKVLRRALRTIKNKKGRSFPMHPQLRKMLEQLPHMSDGFVFHGPSEKPLKYDFVRDHLITDVITPLAEQFRGEDGEPSFQDGTLHSFRHFFCSTCANSGVPENAVMKWLGHSASKMVRHYYHLHDEDAQRQMDSVTFFEVDGQ